MALDVWLHDRHVGVLREGSGGLEFTYGAEALDRVGDPVMRPAVRLSVRLPVRSKPWGHAETAAYFDNLLPDEDVRALLAAATRLEPTDVVALLGAVGGECAGAVSLWPEGMAPPPPAYTPCSAATLERLIARPGAGGVAAALTSGRQSMSGAQEKLVLLRRGRRYWLPKAGSVTTVLVKRSRDRFPGLLHNEHLAMRLMAATGAPVAAAQRSALDPALYECVRYDRVVEGRAVRRLHQEDLCQATGRTARAKYAATGGPTLSEIRTVLDRHSADALEDVRALARWVVANLCLGNFDAHAKNLSLLVTQAGATRLAPFYDVVCTAAYPALGRDLALRVGGATTLRSLSARTLVTLARELRLAPAELKADVAATCDAVLARLTDAAHDVAAEHGDHPVLAEVVRWVKATTPEVRRRLLGGR